MYFDGQGVQENPAEAFKWFRLAADQGHAGAENSLGAIYLAGQGENKIPPKRRDGATYTSSPFIVIPATASTGLFGFKAEQIGRNLLARYLGRKNRRTAGSAAGRGAVRQTSALFIGLAASDLRTAAGTKMGRSQAFGRRRRRPAVFVRDRPLRLSRRVGRRRCGDQEERQDDRSQIAHSVLTLSSRRRAHANPARSWIFRGAPSFSTVLGL
jgi:Sel1 repeat